MLTIRKLLSRNSRYNHSLVLNPFFIAGIVLLVINDHYLKTHYHNWVTGKLSDFVGLIIFPMFLQYVFPKNKHACLITGLLFIIWKLPVSEGLIALYNQIAFIAIQRTIDYSDYIALLVLPFSHFLTQRVENFSNNKLFPIYLNPIVLILPCSFIFMATSPGFYYNRPGGDVHIGKEYRIKLTEEKLLERLKNEGFSILPDTARNREYSNYNHYFIENAIFGKDTIPKIWFAVYRSDKQTLLTINDVTLKGETKITDWRALRRVSIIYRKAIKENIIAEIK